MCSFSYSLKFSINIFFINKTLCLEKNKESDLPSQGKALSLAGSHFPSLEIKPPGKHWYLLESYNVQTIKRRYSD